MIGPIVVRDEATLGILTVVDRWSVMDAVVRYVDVGTWSITLPAEATAAAAFGPGTGIIIDRGPQIISGPLTRILRTVTTEGTDLIVSGVTDDVWLARRLALPDPAGPPYTGQAYDVRTGAAETVMHGFVDANAGPSATAPRQVAGLAMGTDYGRGSSTTYSARFERLDTVLKSVGLAGGDIGFRVVQVGSGLEFQTFTPSDLTGQIILSTPLGTMLQAVYDDSAPSANYIIAGGQGDLTARAFREQGDSASIALWQARIESFYDRTNAANDAELDQGIESELAKGAEVATLKVTTHDTASVVAGRDYWLGDKVTVDLGGGVSVDQQIREVGVHWDAGGEVVTPVPGTPGSRTFEPLPGLFRQVRDHATGLARLQAH